MLSRAAQPAIRDRSSILLAGATMPTVSPGSSAGGRIVARGGMRNAILNEKLAGADDRCRPYERDLACPLDSLRTSGRAHANGRLITARVDGGYRRGTRAGAGGLRLANAAFIKADIQGMKVEDLYELH